MRLIFAFFIYLFSISIFASIPEMSFSDCPRGLPPADVNFCSSFKTVAICHCTAMGIPKFLCKNMNSLYNAMILRYGTVENACASQTDTTKQICLDGWTCYRKGGNDSQGQACSGTGKPCE